MTIPEARRTQCEVFAERYVDCAFELGLVKAAIASVHVAACDAKFGLVDDEVGKAACCVPAEQRPLRALQHFDPLHVIKGHALSLLRGNVDVVDIDSDRGFDSVIIIALGNAADRELHALPAESPGRADARSELGDVNRRGDALCPQGFTRIGGNRDADVLQLFRLALCGDDDFTVLCARCGVRLRVSGGRFLLSIRGTVKC